MTDIVSAFQNLLSQSYQSVVKIDADTTGLQQGCKEAEGIGRRFASSLSQAFQDVAIRGKSLGDTLRGLALQLSRMVLSSALKPLEQGLGNSLGKLFQGLLPFAKGGAIQRGLPVPFAQGGVIQSPVTFPMAGGMLGLAGERGPEAIMPLQRGPDGRLGVAMQGNAGGVNVTFNVSTPDADSFRRSETQLAAMLARAVSLGQRNL